MTRESITRRWRHHTLKVGEALGEYVATRPETAAVAIAVTLDSTFIRSCTEGERHLEVRVGNVETQAGGRQVFGAVAKAVIDLQALIRRTLDAVGRTEDTALSAFTNGCPGLRRVLADAGVTEPPTLDWFHIAMRLQHLKQIASALPVDAPARVAAKAMIATEVERLHWRIWNGKAQDAQVSRNRIRADGGERGDVATPTDVAVAGLVAAGALDSASRVNLARSHVGVAVRQDAPRPDIPTPEAIKAGASDFIEKPIGAPDLFASIEPCAGARAETAPGGRDLATVVSAEVHVQSRLLICDVCAGHGILSREVEKPPHPARRHGVEGSPK